MNSRKGASRATIVEYALTAILLTVAFLSAADALISL